MKIKFLGTKGNIETNAPYHSKNSGILINNILFDVGEEEFMKHQPDYFLFV